jgi:threonine/homoserine/homoserine lactone efflux protein
MFELIALGVTAGFSLAIPLGPMALLLITTTLTRGWKHGIAGGLAMASVDFAYAFIVFGLGSQVGKFMSEWGTALTWVGAGILAVVGGRILWSSIQKLKDAATAGTSADAVAGSVLKTWAKFAAATSVNPPTALFFLAISPSIALIDDQAMGIAAENPWFTALVFAAAVFVASLVWQQAIAAAAFFTRKVTSPVFQVWTGVVGGVLIMSMAAWMALSTLL